MSDEKQTKITYEEVEEIPDSNRGREKEHHGTLPKEKPKPTEDHQYGRKQEVRERKKELRSGYE